MNFNSKLKGKITQSLMGVLLEDADYKIIPLGIEEVIRELASLDREKYMRLELPLPLRNLPDFFVSTKDLDKSCLVEVKFRKRWDEKTRRELQNRLLEQVRTWSPLYLVLFLGRPARNTNTPSSYMGVARLRLHGDELVISKSSTGDQTTAIVPWKEARWDDFSRFQDVFTSVTDRWEDSTLTKTQSVLRQLIELEVADD